MHIISLRFILISGTGLAYNNSNYNPARRSDTEGLGDYSLTGSSSSVSDRVYSSKSDSNRPIVSALGGPGVPQTKDLNGLGLVKLSVIDPKTQRSVIPESQHLKGTKFGSRFGHAVQFIDLDGDG